MSKMRLGWHIQGFRHDPRLLSSYQTVLAPHFADRSRNVLGWASVAMQCEDDGACTRKVMMRTAEAPRNATGPTFADQ
jgi:hypothetical protein